MLFFREIPYIDPLEYGYSIMNRGVSSPFMSLAPFWYPQLLYLGHTLKPPAPPPFSTLF